DGVAGVVLAAEQLLELQRIEAFRDALDLAPELVERVGVTFLRQLEVDLRLVHALALPAPSGDGGLHPRVLPGDGLRALGVVPEAGRRRPLAQLGGTLLEAAQVKDASRPPRRSRPPPAPPPAHP